MVKIILGVACMELKMQEAIILLPGSIIYVCR